MGKSKATNGSSTAVREVGGVFRTPDGNHQRKFLTSISGDSSNAALCNVADVVPSA